MLWLGEKRGCLIDWITQRWVQLTGRRVRLGEAGWLAGPVGSTRCIGPDAFAAIARAEGLDLRHGPSPLGILPDFARLRSPNLDVEKVHPHVRDFYERTSAYELDVWSEWSGLFRPLGWLLAVMFSRRLQQLNVPLSPLDTSRGVTSELIHAMEPASGDVRYAVWVRQLVGPGHTLYAAAYGLSRLPGHDGMCVRVVFPLPNGNAMVILRPSVDSSGALTLLSAGERFGDPGFYFTVQAGRGEVWARYVPQLREKISLYSAADALRADHVVSLWGATFLRMHYRLRPSMPTTLSRPGPVLANQLGAASVTWRYSA